MVIGRAARGAATLAAMLRQAPINASTGHSGDEILARLATSPGSFAIGQGVPDVIMWMPGGVHEIRATQSGRPVTKTVLVDAATARVAQAALAAMQPPRRAWLDFNHDGAAASGRPLEFFWSDAPQPGVYARVEWSTRGIEALQGREYRDFSPSFYVDASTPARVVGVPNCMGGLVNDPAFRAIRPVVAKHHPDPNPMNKSKQLIQLLSAITALQAERNVLAARTDGDHAAAIAAKDTEINAKLSEANRLRSELETSPGGSVTVEITDASEALAAKDADIASLRQQVQKVEAELEASRSKEHEAAIQAAIARGAIGSKDEAVLARWRSTLKSTPDSIQLLNALQGPAGALAARVIAPAAGRGGSVEVTQVDCNDALRGYVTAGNPRAAGEVYHREIHPRLERGERIPFERYAKIDATNTLGTLVGNIISQRTLSLVYSRRPMLQGILTDLSDEQVRLNQSVYVRKIGLPSVADFGSSASATSDTDVTVTVDTHKQVLFSYTATEYNGTGRDLVREHSEALAVALGNHLVDAVAALITDAFTSESTGAASTRDYSSLTGTTKTLNTNGVPDLRRFGWVNAAVAEALRNDELIMASFERPAASAYAHWRNVEGFENIWEFPALPDNSVNLIAFFGMADALVLATRVVLDPTSIAGVGYPGKIGTVTDPVTGLSVVSNQWIDSSSLAVNDRLILAYGCARGNVTCGHKWVTS